MMSFVNFTIFLFLLNTVQIKSNYCDVEKYFLIRNAASVGVLQASAKSVTVQLFTGDTNQLWKFEGGNQPGTFYLANKQFPTTGFRPVLDGNHATRNTPPLFFPPHLASHISSQFSPPLFPTLKGFPGLCSCCPIKPMTSLLPSTENSQISPSGNDQRSSSVAELRRKAQEHSAALLQSLQHVANFQQAAGLASSLNFPLLPPLTTLQALNRKHEMPPPPSETSGNGGKESTT